MDPTLFIIIGLVVLQLFAPLGAYIWSALALGGMARKAGEPTWAGWVPVYNWIVFFRIARRSPIPFLVGLFGGLLLGVVISFVATAVMSTGSYQAGNVISVIGLFVMLAALIYGTIEATIAAHRINLNFGLGGGYTVLYFFFGLIWMSVLAWGSARWIGPTRSSAPQLPAAAPPVPSATVATGPVLAGGDPRPTLSLTPEPWKPSMPAAPSSLPGAASAPAGLTPPPPPPPPPPPGAAPPERMTIAPPPTAPAPAAAGGADSPWAPKTAPIAAASAAPAVAAAPAAPPATPVSAVPAPAPVSSVPAPPAPGSRLVATEEPDGETVAAPARPVEADADVEDRTVIAPRARPPQFALVLADGGRLPLTADVVLLGRKPVAQREYPGAQLLPVPDPTKTVSKNHALLRRGDSGWTVTDLASTNGIATYTADGAETVIQPGVATAVPGDFALGQARMRVVKDD